ncbi:MAG: HDOD domain-containing protein [Acidobacteriota bacterium]
MSKDFLQLLETRVSGRGDLPVFRASVLEVVRLSEDTQCAASDIARVILQDQGFSVKVLRIANSPYYNRSDHSIKTISRAVVLLGVEVVRDICLGLGFVEVFQRHHPWIDLRRILARGYFTAVLTRELAGLLRDSRKEEMFLAGLLQYLGPLAVAYYLPEKFLEVQQFVQGGHLKQSEAERKVLGQPFTAFGEALADRWALPTNLVQALQKSAGNNGGRRGQNLLQALPQLSHSIAEDLFGEDSHGPRTCDVAEEIKRVYSIGDKQLGDIIESAFSESRRSSSLYGLEADALRPKPPDAGASAGDPLRARLVRRLEAARSSAEVPSQEALLECEEKDKNTVQLELLREISLHILENRDLTTLFNLIMEGVQRVAGFDRIVLALCNPERTELTGKYGFGLQAHELAKRMRVPMATENLFARCLSEKKALFILNADDEPYASLLPAPLRNLLGAKSFAVSPLYSSDRTVGLFYVDNALSDRPITLEDYRIFEHFTLQANLALDRHRLRL